jgi:hypothetical protein
MMAKIIDGRRLAHPGSFARFQSGTTTRFLAMVKSFPALHTFQARTRSKRNSASGCPHLAAWYCQAVTPTDRRKRSGTELFLGRTTNYLWRVGWLSISVGVVTTRCKCHILIHGKTSRVLTIQRPLNRSCGFLGQCGASVESVTNCFVAPAVMLGIADDPVGEYCSVSTECSGDG